MAIIYSYPLNDNIKSLDELVGTTEKNINGQLKTVTRNFLLQDLAEFFIVDGGLQKEITLTTNNTSGPATLNQTTGILNIPEYANYWTKTGIDIQNNNTGHVQVRLQSGKQLQTLNSAGTLVSLIDETGASRFGAIPSGALSYSYSSIGPLGGNVYLTLGRAISISGVSTQVGTSFLLGNPSAVLFPNQQPYTVSSANYFGTSYIAGSLEPSASAGAEHSFNIGNSVGNGITSGIFRISRTRVQSTVPVKYATDLSASYDDRTLVDKGYVITGLSTKENSLPTVPVDGYVLSSTVAGVRSWVAQSGSSTPSLQQVLDFNRSLVDGRNFQGTGSGTGATNATYSNFFGSSAGEGALNASSSNFLGADSGRNATNASGSNFLGNQAGWYAASASNSNFLGDNAGYYATSANKSNFMGQYAGYQASGANNSNFIGFSAGMNATNAVDSNFFGTSAGEDATGAYDSNFIGNTAGSGAAGAYQSNFMGTSAGYYATGSYKSNFFGVSSGANSTNAYKSNFFGESAGNEARFANNSNFLGSGAGDTATNAHSSNFFGEFAGKLATGAQNSNFLGNNSGYGASSASFSNFLGQTSGYGAVSATESNFIGQNSGYEATGARNSNFIGESSGYQAASASYSNFFGSYAGYQSINATNSNFFGQSAGDSAINASYSNLFGYQAGLSFTGNSIGSNNIIIGTNISLPTTATNSINLGGVLFGKNTYSTITGNPSIAAQTNGRIGINVVDPTNTLHIYSETVNTSGLRLERLTSSSPTSTGQAIGVDASGNVVTVASGSSSQDLQSVTDIGATTTKGITITVGDGGGDGIHSFSSQGYGIYGSSSETIGVYGTANSTGVYGQGNVGVHAYSAEGTGIEVYGNGGISISVNLGNSNKGLVINSGASSTGNPIEIVKSDDIKFTINQQGEQSIVKIPGGLSTEYLMADGTTTTGGTGGGGIPHATASGTDTYTATISGVASYSDGDAYLIRFTIGNTTVATLNINALGVIPLYRNNDGPLIGGDIQANGEMLCVYNSTTNTFQCIGTSPNSIISYVTNAETVTITKGQVVYAFGGTGDRMTVKLASNIGDSTSAQTVGIVLSASIAANQKGFIIFQGLIDNLNILPTSTWADGDQVYLGVTAGSITKVKPYAPNHLVYVGIVTTASNGNSGRMYVRVQNGYELDELHNVQAQTPTLKDTLYYDNTVSPAQWKTSSISSILGYTPANDASVMHLAEPETVTGVKTFSSSPKLNTPYNLVPTIVGISADGSIYPLYTGTYPDQTEISYVKGVTSAIQTQLNGKQPINANLTSISALSTTSGASFVKVFNGNYFLDNAVGAQGAYTILANNTGASAAPTEQVYKEVAQQSLSGIGMTATGGAIPTGTNTHFYRWSQIGNLVTVRINLQFGTAGTCSGIAIPFANMPDIPQIPQHPSIYATALDMITFGSGSLAGSKLMGTFTVGSGMSGIRIKTIGTPNTYEIVVGRASGSYNNGWIHVQYYI